MKVLFSTYNLAFQNLGGGEQVLIYLQQELQKLGHTVDYFDPIKHKIEHYDVIHYFSCLETSFWLYKQKKAPHIPLFVTPTLFQPDTISFQLNVWRKNLLEYLNRWLIGTPTTREQFRIPSYWLPTTKVEANLLERYWNINPKNMYVLPNGVEEKFSAGQADLIQKHINCNEPFILHVGNFHPVKNQHRLMRE